MDMEPRSEAAFWSTSWPIAFVDKGRLSRTKYTKEYDTTVRYRDGSGKQRFKGSAKLKQSQSFCFFSALFYSLYFGVWKG